MKIKLSPKNKKIIFSVVAVLGLLAFLGSRIKAPIITIIEPNNNVTVQTKDINIKGIVEPAQSSLSINDQTIALDNKGNFNFKLALQNGINIAKIQAKNSGQISEATLSINREFTEEEKADIEKQNQAQLEAQKKAEAERIAKEQAKAAIDEMLTAWKNLGKVDDWDILTKGEGVVVYINPNAWNAMTFNEKKDMIIKFGKSWAATGGNTVFFDNINGESFGYWRAANPDTADITEESAEQKAWDNSKAGQICKKYPLWKKSDCEAVANKKFWLGMSYDMLVYELGKPNSANPSNYGSGTSWQWCWYDITPSCFYDTNDDGLVDSYN